MAVKMEESQASEINSLAEHCCNWEEGTCLLLDMPCPQQLSLTRINCTYFREAVLPAFPEADEKVKRYNKEEK